MLVYANEKETKISCVGSDVGACQGIVLLKHLPKNITSLNHFKSNQLLIKMFTQHSPHYEQSV